VEEAATTQQDLEALEEEQFGISHTKIGGIYAEKWNFPRALLLAIKYHHKVDRNIENPILHLLAAAIGLAQERGIGMEYVDDAADQLHVALKRLRISRKQALTLVEDVQGVACETV
jgi:HD-like signal output (HDOD) protein